MSLIFIDFPFRARPVLGTTPLSEVDSCMWGKPRAYRNPELNQLAPFKMPSPLPTSSSRNSMQSNSMQSNSMQSQSEPLSAFPASCGLSLSALNRAWSTATIIRWTCGAQTFRCNAPSNTSGETLCNFAPSTANASAPSLPRLSSSVVTPRTMSMRFA